MSSNTSEKELRLQKKPLALILVKRVAIFFFALCLVAILFWYTGSFQSFLDSTQAMLMSLLKYSALCLLLAAAAGLGLSVAFALLRRYPLGGWGFSAYILLCAFAAACLVLADALLILHAGLGQ